MFMTTEKKISELFHAIDREGVNLDNLVESMPELGSKWHNAGQTLRGKLPEKKVNKLQRKVKDRMFYHHDMYKSAMSGGSGKKEAETHFVQMLKMKHLLMGLQGSELKKGQ
jgi:hypothetical protein